MVYAPEMLLGVGVYTPAEAAMYAGVSSALMSRWVHGTSSHKSAVRAQLNDRDERIVTFLDFIQAMTIRELRRTHFISLSKIRKTVDRAAEIYQVEYPFARPHKTFVVGKEVFIELDGFGMVHMTGKQPNQLLMKRVVEDFMKHVTYDDSGLVSQYIPFEFRGHRIVMNPKRFFGEPIVESCRYPARVLWEAYESEGGFTPAATAFGVNVEQVQAACLYREKLEAMAA